MKIYEVVIIGCGSIGAMKPDNIDYPGSSNILTHANAVDRHPRTNLLALIDTDLQQLHKAAGKWGPQIATKSLDEIKNKQIDIVIIAVPTEYHYETLIEVLKIGYPKLIIAEKPFCLNTNEANLIMERAKECCIDGRRKIPIMIDYIRRYAQGYKDIKKQIDSGTFGKALNCRVLYTRGLFHEGCHAIDLMRYFFGKCEFKNKLTFCKSIVDRDKNDPTIDFKLIFENCNSVIFQPCDGRKYGIFEVDICFENCRLRFIDNGLYIEKYPINEENEWGHKSLDYRLTNVTRQETGLNIALYDLINNAVNFLDEKEDLICTDRDAIAIHEILEGLK